jgi:hypothetical protein
MIYISPSFLWSTVTAQECNRSNIVQLAAGSRTGAMAPATAVGVDELFI